MSRGPEQLPLPIKEDLNKLEVSWLMIVSLENPLCPKILVSQKTDGGYTFPGGKNEGKSAFETVKAELHEEVGIDLESEDQVFKMSEIEFGSRDRYFHAHPYLTFTDMLQENINIQNLEPDKHKLWEWISLNQLAHLISSGDLPLPIWDELDWIYQVKEEAFIEWAGDALEAPVNPPTYIFYECHDYKVRGLWQKFIKLYLKPPSPEDYI